MTASPTFYWHDYETWGRVPRRDWPSQFAGLRTDAELNPVGDPLMIMCRPPTDRLPDPEACLLTGQVPQQTEAEGLPEHAFAAAIERELARPGTVGVGYNSIRFDDEVTRHLFWRNLVDPYAREWQHQCGRWDLLDTVRCCWALRPEGLEWPTHEDGRPSFKLEHLTAANGLAHEAAHDALSDVRATVALARLIRERKRPLWDFCLALRHKDAVWQQVGLGEPRPFLHLSGMYGVERGCMAIVWPLGAHPTNRNELIVWDLSADPTLLEGLDATQVRERLYTKAEALPEGMARLPIKTIHVNRSPVVVGNLKTLSASAAERFGLDVAQAMRHADTARRLPVPPRELWAEVFARPSSPPPDVDEDLYGGFIGADDRRRLDRLRAMPPADLPGQRLRFEDARLDELVFRWRARNFADTLSADEAARWEAHRAARLHLGQGGATTLAAFLDRIDQLGEHADERGQSILEALVDWADTVAPPHP